ncbi:MAG TPA: SIS domain-containing protein [Clostridia bacterium]|nr:SIS domain-containing protein [Clostridia bacterium]
MPPTRVMTQPSTCGMDPNITEGRQYVHILTSTAAKLDPKEIDHIAEVLFEAYRDEKSVFIVGNGGSAALASHFACDLGKGVTFNNGKKRMRALSLTDNVPLMTAWANDVGYEWVFAEQLRNFVAPGDVVFAISGSGNSANVLHALQAAKAAGAKTIGITGFKGGKMKALCDACLVVPSDNMQIIEDLHTVTAHALSTILYNMVADAQAATSVRLAEAA